MALPEKVRRDFMITVYQDGETPPAIRVEFVPRGLQAVREPGGAPTRVPAFLVRAYQQGKKIQTTWEAPPPADFKVNRKDLEKEAADRLSRRVSWLGLLSELIDLVEGWARDLGWSTQRIRKELKDSEIGNYQTRALLLQEGTARVLLEPVGRGGPGAEGVVDLYLLPAYDDIASLYYYDGQWNLHYMAPGTPSVGNIREANSTPLSKPALRKVLEEMKANVP